MSRDLVLPYRILLCSKNRVEVEVCTSSYCKPLMHNVINLIFIIYMSIYMNIYHIISFISVHMPRGVCIKCVYLLMFHLEVLLHPSYRHSSVKFIIVLESIRPDSQHRQECTLIKTLNWLTCTVAMFPQTLTKFF